MRGSFRHVGRQTIHLSNLSKVSREYDGGYVIGLQRWQRLKPLADSSCHPYFQWHAQPRRGAGKIGGWRSMLNGQLAGWTTSRNPCRQKKTNSDFSPSGATEISEIHAKSNAKPKIALGLRLHYCWRKIEGNNLIVVHVVFCNNILNHVFPRV